MQVFLRLQLSTLTIPPLLCRKSYDEDCVLSLSSCVAIAFQAKVTPLALSV